MNEEKIVMKTFKELQDIDLMVGGLYAKIPTLKDSKFGYAYKRFTDKNYAPIIRNFNEDLAALRVEKALEDKDTKEVLIDRNNPRGYKYSKEGLLSVMAEERILENKYNAKELEAIPYITADVPEGLTEEQFSQLKGLILE